MSRRSCVSEGDIVVLGEMLRDKDRITRMATASVLTDFGPDGRRVVQTRLAEVEDVSEKLMLQDALDAAAKPDYRPILQYPLTDAERRHIHGCGHKVSAEVTRPTIPHYDAAAAIGSVQQREGYDRKEPSSERGRQADKRPITP